MAFPTGAAVAESGAGESSINDLLGADLAITETEPVVTEDTSVADEEVQVEDAPESEVGDEEATETEGDEPDDEDTCEEDESGEQDFNVDDLETDFAESAYARAAAHYSKQFGKQLDPNDKGDRAILRELMDRGRKISELQTSKPEGTDEDAEETPVKEAPAVTKTPEQQLQDRIGEVRNYAKASVNPVVAKAIVLPMMQAMVNFIWGKDKAAKIFDGRSDAELAEVTEALSAAMVMQQVDTLPMILGEVPKVMESRYPFFSNSQETAAKEAAVQKILDETDENGNPAYPGFDKLVNNGAINRIMANELKGVVFNKDPQINREALYKAAFKMARNARVDPKMLEQASRKGREAEKDRQKRVAAGRTPPGSSNRGGAPARGQLLNDLVGNGSSKSSALFKNVGIRK